MLLIKSGNNVSITTKLKIRKIKSKKDSKTIFKNMANLAIGTALGKLITLACIPLITRLYDPEDLGVLAIYSSIVLTVAPLLTLRYVVSLPLPNSQFLAVNLFVICTALIIINSTIFAIFYYYCFSKLFPDLISSELASMTVLVILGVICASFYELLNSWGVRTKSFKYMAKAQVIQNGTGAGVKVVLGALLTSASGLIVGQFLQHFAGCLYLSKKFYLDIKKGFKRIKVSKVVFLLKYYSDFPKYRLPSQFLMVFCSQSPLLFSANLFGSKVTGQLGLALMAIALPIQLIGNATGSAYYSEVARIGRHDIKKVKNLTNDVVRKLLIMAILPTLLLFLWGEELFEIVFGSKWAVAGSFASILSVYLIFQFISSPIVNVLTVFSRQRLFLYINTFRALLVAVVFILASKFEFEPTMTLTVYSLALAGHYLLTLITVYRSIY